MLILKNTASNSSHIFVTNGFKRDKSDGSYDVAVIHSLDLAAKSELKIKRSSNQ